MTKIHECFFFFFHSESVLPSAHSLWSGRYPATKQLQEQLLDNILVSPKQTFLSAWQPLSGSVFRLARLFQFGIASKAEVPIENCRRGIVDWLLLQTQLLLLLGKTIQNDSTRELPFPETWAHFKGRAKILHDKRKHFTHYLKGWLSFQPRDHPYPSFSWAMSGNRTYKFYRHSAFKQICKPFVEWKSNALTMISHPAAMYNGIQPPMFAPVSASHVSRGCAILWGRISWFAADS
jgi:hypothetical protein